MIRVGFALSSGYMGNVNYYRNLLRATFQLQDRQIEPVLLVGLKANEEVWSGLPEIEVIRSGLFDQFGPRWTVRKSLQLLVARDPILLRFLRANRIDLLSHSDFLGKRASIPTICWIGDFQHMKQPQFFKRSELVYRNRDFRLQSRNATLVLLSSHDAQNDLARFEPDSVPRSRVLQFVSQVVAGDQTPTLDDLRHKYGVEKAYFHVPNQFWAHKNHGLILEAIAILKRQGRTIQVVSTGATEDYRQPDFFDRLMKKAVDLDVIDRFKVLGLIPYDDLVGMMVHSLAMLNPSRAEGWSTSVEEAKSLGKRIILSDIAVHIEQAPPDGIYISPDNPHCLADAMVRVMDTYDEAKEHTRMAQAKQQLPHRVEAFASRYQDIVKEAIQLHRAAKTG